MNDPVMAVHEASVSYRDGSGRRTILDRVDCSILAGEMVAIQGPSGCGKTTLISLMALLRRPDSGTISLNGVDVGHASHGTRTRHRLTSIGYVPQDCALIDHESIQTNVGLPLSAGPARVAARLRKERVSKALTAAGLDLDPGRKATGLSGGERQKVAIARALINHPALVLADEPTAALDSDSTQTLCAQLRSVCTTGAAVVIATHDPIVATACDRVLTLDRGHLTQHE